MITIAAAVEKIVKESPLLEEGLASGIVNLSALSRIIRPQVEAEVKKPAGEGALVMALKRLAPKLTRKTVDPRKILRQIKDVTVRSNIIEFTFHNSDTILECQQRLLHEIRGLGDPFITCTQGVHEMTVMVTTGLEPLVEKVFAGEKRVSRLTGLAAIGIHLTPKVVGMPGVYYAILKQLMWASINVVEVVSTYTELTIILEKRQVDRAFAILKSYLWP